MTNTCAGRRVEVIVALLLCLASSPVLAADRATPSPLFAEHAALEMEFEVDFDEICRNPTRGKCEDLPATIYYMNDQGTRVRIDARVRTRGRWRRDTAACVLPALFVYFDPTQVEGTLFENQTMLPFTTHCQSYKVRYHQYAMLEYLAHRYYQLLTDASLNVRLTRTAFRDTGGTRHLQRYGFFVEHFQSTAARIGAEYIDVEKLDPRETDAMELATLSLFQYMIGNLDWSVVKSHNIALFRRENGAVTAIPYDFDYSGIVNAEYATPPDLRPTLHNVRARRYWGFCRPEIDWDEIFAKFHAIHTEAMQLLDELPAVSKARRREARHYVNGFFATIESEKKRKQKIINQCRRLPSPNSG